PVGARRRPRAVDLEPRRLPDRQALVSAVSHRAVLRARERQADVHGALGYRSGAGVLHRVAAPSERSLLRHYGRYVMQVCMPCCMPRVVRVMFAFGLYSSSWPPKSTAQWRSITGSYARPELSMEPAGASWVAAPVTRLIV